MSGMIAMEGELNGIVQEYLEYFGFDITLERFKEECNNKGKPIANLEKKINSNQKVNMIMNEMVQLFLQGQRKEFFRCWMENIPSQLLNDDIKAQRLEFELNINFAINPFRKGLGGKDLKIESEESMNAFKSFLENRGRALSHTREFQPYFALPYVPNPQQNYQEIFTDAWHMELQTRLETFLKDALKLQGQPRLIDLFNKKSFDNTANDFLSDISRLEQQLRESEKRTMGYMKRFNKVQADYHNLIGVTAELVDSLESTVRGKPVQPEYITDICKGLFNSQLKQSIDFSRPGTAGDYIRKSLAYQKTSNADPRTNHGPVQLDFAKIKQDLVNKNERRQLLLLQALRWRLTKCETAELRQKVLNSYIVGDIINCRSERVPNQILNLLRSPSDGIRQYMARLMNAFASLNHGRSYLASNVDVVKAMQQVLRSEKGNTTCKENLLAALQKLSVRRNLVTIMINENLTEWLVDLLEDNEELTDYSLEYAIALLMNLCLRYEGKKRCAKMYEKTLKVLTELLGNTNSEIRPLVNGALYHVLSVPEIRNHAKVMNLESILRGYLVDGPPEMNIQIDFIIKQLNSEKNEIEPDNDQEDEDDEEDSDAMEAELDRGEIITRTTQEELIGESLLSAEYSQANSDFKSKSKTGADYLHESTILSRPITPQQLRQSMMFQSQKSSQPVTNKPSSASRANQSMVIRDSNKLSHSTLNPIINRSNSATTKSVNARGLQSTSTNEVPFSSKQQMSRQTSVGNNTFEFTPGGGNKTLNNKLLASKNSLNNTTSSKANVETSKKVNILTLDHSLDDQQQTLVDDSLFINRLSSSSNAEKNMSAKINHSTNYESKVYDNLLSKDEFDIEEVDENEEDEADDDVDDDETRDESTAAAAEETTKSYFKSQSIEKPASLAKNPVASIRAFETRSKLQRTPVQSVVGGVYENNQSGTIVTPTTSYMPFFSVNEPRPSSANSIRSKNSSNSATLVRADDSTGLFSNPIESSGSKPSNTFTKKFGKI